MPACLSMATAADPTCGLKEMPAVTESAARDLFGSFRDLPLADLTSWLGNKQKDGVLQIRNGMVRKEFRFRRGRPYFFRSSLPEEQLEQMLAQLEIAELERLQQLRSEALQQKIPYGDYLVKQLPIPKAELRAIADQLLYLALDDAMQWPQGEFRFRFSLPKFKQPASAPASATAEESPAPPPTLERIRADEAIFRTIGKQILSGKVEIPPMPDTLMKVQQCLNQEDWSSQKLMKIIMADQILTTNILRTANSSLYGLASKVSSLQHAIVLMGIRTILGIVTHYVLSGSFSKEQKAIRAVLDHSFHCAVIAHKAASMAGCDAEEAFSCGLLHDIGKTVLLSRLADYGLPEDTKRGLIDRFHVDAGVLMAQKWNLPEVVTEVIRHHHDPLKADGARLLVEVVYLANSLVHMRDDLDDLQHNCCNLPLERIDFAELRDTLGELLTANL